MQILSEAFYHRPALAVAPELLGCVLVHETAYGRLSGKIVETEAYGGPGDLACHASSGRPTRRTEVMFGPPGFAYVYFIYGMYCCFNVVTAAAGQAEAVLIRALEPLEGLDVMRGLRRRTKAIQLCSGPGKLCQALRIDRSCNQWNLRRAPLYLTAGAPETVSIGRSRRINVDYAGPASHFEWRFFIPGNPHVSRGGGRQERPGGGKAAQKQ